MIWGGYVARMRRMGIDSKFYSENLKAKYHLEDLILDARRILKSVLEVSMRIGFIYLRIWSSSGPL
jgi:hypothetical protein